GALVVPLHLVELGPVLAGVCDPEGESDHLAQVGDGAVEIALAPVRECALVVGDGGIFRGFAAALDDARAGGDAAIRIVPLASVPVGPARGCGRGCGHKQRSRPDKDPQYAHDPLPCGWEAYHCSIGKGKAGASFPQPASAPAATESNPRGLALVVRQRSLWVRSSGGFRGGLKE